MSMNCKQCGAALADGDLFCSECGARVFVAQAKTPTTDAEHGASSDLGDLGDIFGQFFGKDHAQGTARANLPTGNTRTRQIAIIVAAVCVLAVIVLLLITSGGPAKSSLRQSLDKVISPGGGVDVDQIIQVFEKIPIGSSFGEVQKQLGRPDTGPITIDGYGTGHGWHLNNASYMLDVAHEGDRVTAVFFNLNGIAPRANRSAYDKIAADLSRRLGRGETISNGRSWNLHGDIWAMISHGDVNCIVAQVKTETQSRRTPADRRQDSLSDLEEEIMRDVWRSILFD